MFKRDILTALGVFAFAVAVIVNARGYSEESRFFPQLVAGALALLAIMMFVRTLQSRARTPENGDAMFEAPWRMLLVVVLTAIYFTAFSVVGFTLASVIFIPLSAWLFGYRKLWVTVPVAVAFVVGLIALFNGILGLPMPPDLVLATF